MSKVTKVDFYRHHLGQLEFASVMETLQSSFLTAGPKTAEFEARFADYQGGKHVVGLNSCTAGLFLALKALGIGEGDEVIVPAMTFIATANVVSHCGARPILVDVEKETGLIDPAAVKAVLSERTKAIMPVHLYGQLADMKSLRKLADGHQLALVEDAAHAVESERDGVKTGQLGDVAAFSFYATKNLASGEGGAVSTNRRDLHDKIRLLRQHGMSKSAAERYHGNYQHWDMLELGYKYNMFDIQAAMLLPQLEGIERRLRRREEICAYYEREFLEAGIEFPATPKNSRSARHLFTVWAPPERRDAILSGLQAAQIGVAVNYRAIHLLQYYRETFNLTRGMFPNAESIGDRTLTLPLYPSLTDAEVEYVVENVVRQFKA